MTGDSRANMVSSAATLIGAQGVSATSFSDVLAVSGAPRGSIYHHFPDGKKQLAEEAIRFTSERVLAYLTAVQPVKPVDVLERFIGLWRNVVLNSDGSAGCVVAGVAIDTGADDVEALQLVRATFRSWTGTLTEQLRATGLAAERAEAIAIATLAGMEGALILCRAEGDVRPLDIVAQQLLRLLTDS
jgi:TetR/AcrR family transcriptional regulator, lmrAB and yxaGH operons repressor